jgi:uncharacterized protein YecT (DUF1311 family)
MGSFQNDDKCSNPGGEQDRAICLERDYRAADAELNRAYEALQERISETERKSLTRAERAWLKRRDAQCEVETSVGVETGQFPHSEAVRGCYLDMTETRTQALKAQPRPRDITNYKPAEMDDPVCKVADTVSGGYETKDLPAPFKEFVPFIPADERLDGLTCMAVSDLPGTRFVMLTRVWPYSVGSVFILARERDNSLRLDAANHSAVRNGGGYVQSSRPGFFTVDSGWGDGTEVTDYKFSFRYSPGTETWVLDSVVRRDTVVDRDPIHQTSKEQIQSDRWTATDFGYLTFSEFDGAKYEL